MSRFVHSLSIFAILLALAALLVSVPGGVCVCAKASSDSASCDAASCDDRCGDEGEKPSGDQHPQPGDRDCSHGCSLVCCSHPPLIGWIALSVPAGENPPTRLIPPPASTIETSSRPPLLPPPRA